MKIQYFNTCWNDLKNSPGWKGKICLLALLNMVPVFGLIVTFGYAYGWSREAAWGMRNPLPRSIFNNHDGMFWRRGWFSIVVTVAWTILPWIVYLAGDIMLELGLGTNPLSYSSEPYGPLNPGLLASGILIYLISLALTAFASVLSWVGCIRSAIYNKLKPGVQLGAVWKMTRRDGFGLFKIFGMLLSLILVAGAAIVIVVLLVSLGAIVPLWLAIKSNKGMALPLMIALIAVGLILILAYCFVAYCVNAFTILMVARAIGYWTWQFDVAHWGQPSDPLPFEAYPKTHPRPDYGRNDPPER